MNIGYILNNISYSFGQNCQCRHDILFIKSVNGLDFLINYIVPIFLGPFSISHPLFFQYHKIPFPENESMVYELDLSTAVQCDQGLVDKVTYIYI